MPRQVCLRLDYVCILEITIVNKLHLGSSLRSPPVDSRYTEIFPGSYFKILFEDQFRKA